jgi:hypothetical protein
VLPHNATGSIFFVDHGALRQGLFTHSIAYWGWGSEPLVEKWTMLYNGFTGLADGGWTRRHASAA